MHLANESDQDTVVQPAIARLRQGEIAGLTPLVELYYQKATQVAYWILLDHGLAEDVVQEAFLKFFCRVVHFDEGRFFWPYFRQIVTNDALKEHERRQREVDLDVVEQLIGTVDHLDRIDLYLQLDEALRALTPRQRTIIVLAYGEGYRESEIARRLKIAAGTVKSTKADARKKMFRWLTRGISKTEKTR